MHPQGLRALQGDSAPPHRVQPQLLRALHGDTTPPKPWTQGLPENGAPATVCIYAAVLVSMGLLKSWSQPACNNPIFAEIVPPRFRNLIYAFDRCFEGEKIESRFCVSQWTLTLTLDLKGREGLSTKTKSYAYERNVHA